MKAKTEKLIITFPTTADAIAMEQLCKQQHIAGRLIPVPREISAGCGLAWCSEPDQLAQLTQCIKLAGIEIEAFHQLLL